MGSRSFTLPAIAGLVLMAAAPAFAQSHQRAPGVPMAPDPSVIDRELIIEQGVTPRAPAGRSTLDRHVQARPETQTRAERDPPMPRPVPSIIQQ